MIRKDLRRRLRAPVGLVVMLIFPLAFAGLVGMAFGDRGGGTGMPRIKVLLADQDEGLLSQTLSGASANEEFSEFFEMITVGSEAEGRRRMEAGEASALLVIPAGFSADLLDGRPASLILVKNPAESILPQVVEETIQVGAVMLDSGVRVLGEPLKAVNDVFVQSDGEFKIPAAAVLSTVLLQLTGRLQPLNHYIFPPLLTFDTVSDRDVPLAALAAARAGDSLDTLKAQQAELQAQTEDAAATGFNIFGFMLPMVALVSILFLAENGMRDLLLERVTGTLTRQFASPAGVGKVLLAKVGFTLLLCVLSMVILMVAGLLLGWVPLSVNLPGLGLHTVATCLAATGLVTLIYGVVRTERAATAVHSATVMGMSFLGGSFMPVQQMPAALQAIAPFTINYWGIQGLQDLTIRQAGVADIALFAAVLAAIGVAGVAAGGFFLARRFAAGAAS